jgi:hypothetical protein
VGRLVVWAAREKKVGWGCLLFFFPFFSIPFSHFLFKLLLKILSKFLNQLLTTQSIQKPCIQHDAQTLGF